MPVFLYFLWKFPIFLNETNLPAIIVCMSERRVWFVTRPCRDPLYHKDALRALQVATNNFSDTWEHNRSLQKKYEEELIKEGLKADHVSNSGSGGRTWVAMLKTYGYVYLLDNGRLKLTKVGQKILANIKVKENVTKQLLSFQIPNPYFLEPSFRPKFEDGFSIRPIRFLLKLLNQAQLSFQLSKEEIIFFALRAKHDSDIVKTTSDIIRFRASSPEEQQAIKNDIACDFDHRERSDKGARDYEQANGDVATTFMLLTKYVGFVEYDHGKNGVLAKLLVSPENQPKLTELLVRSDIRYPFNKRYLISAESFAENNGLDVDSYKAPRAAPVSVASSSAKLMNKARVIIESHPEVDPTSQDEVKKLLISTSEFDEETIQKIIDSLDFTECPRLSDSFVEAYLNEKDPIEFEKKTAQVLQLLGMNVWHDPDPVLNRGPRIEIAASSGDVHLGIIDCKLYKRKFPLSSNLADYMGSEYIPDYDGYRGMKVEYFGYITSGDFSGEENLAKATENAKLNIPGRTVRGFIMSARTLLALVDSCLSLHIPEEVCQTILASLAVNKAYRSLDDMGFIFGE